MKGKFKLSRGILAGLAALWVVMFGGVAAAATVPQVAGTVAFGGVPAAGASVSVVCNASVGTHTRSATTSGTGHYSVSFLAGQCGDESSVTVTATSSDGAAAGQTVGAMGAGGTSQRVNLDVGMTSVSPVPEFGLLTAAAGLLAVAVTFTYLRRHTRAPQRSA